jgi:hypothetical protein
MHDVAVADIYNSNKNNLIFLLYTVYSVTFVYWAQNFSYSYVRNNLVRSISWRKQTYQSGPFDFTPNLIGQCQSADRPYEIITYVRGTEVPDSGRFMDRTN